MERFKKRIELYTNFILEKKVSDFRYYTKLIYENHRIIKILENNLMTPDLFSTYKHNYRWDISNYLSNVIWCCEECLHEFSSERPDRTWDVEDCPNCYEVLTYRTGGGQSDPFNYTFKYK